MELGATVCTLSPLCFQCPLTEECRVYNGKERERGEEGRIVFACFHFILFFDTFHQLVLERSKEEKEGIDQGKGKEKGKGKGKGKEKEKEKETGQQSLKDFFRTSLSSPSRPPPAPSPPASPSSSPVVPSPFFKTKKDENEKKEEERKEEEGKEEGEGEEGERGDPCPVCSILPGKSQGTGLYIFTLIILILFIFPLIIVNF